MQLEVLLLPLCIRRIHYLRCNLLVQGANRLRRTDVTSQPVLSESQEEFVSDTNQVTTRTGRSASVDTTAHVDLLNLAIWQRVRYII